MLVDERGKGQCRVGGSPRGTFGLKVLSARGMRPDLWQSGFSVSRQKTKARVLRGRREASCGCSLRGVPGWMDLGLLLFYRCGRGKYARFCKYKSPVLIGVLVASGGRGGLTHPERLRGWRGASRGCWHGCGCERVSCGVCGEEVDAGAIGVRGYSVLVTVARRRPWASWAVMAVPAGASVALRRSLPLGPYTRA